MTQTIAAPARRPPRLLTVGRTEPLTPNMIRVTFAGPDLADLPADCAGANCKILLPAPGQTWDAFASQLADGPRPTTRTYTVRHARPALGEMDIDFVAHGDEGPASAWALRAGPGSFCGFTGPSAPKVASFYADWYLVAADMAALPVAAATLEAMPRKARGVAIFEVTSQKDRQAIDAPPGIDQRWLVHPDPHRRSDAQERLIRSLDWPTGTVQTCVAGESGVIRGLRAFLINEKGLTKQDAYISGYWKIGLVEDEHQKARKAGLAG